MSTPFLGEIRAFSFNFPPKGWAACNGQLLPINQNQALFSLLGTTYGGNGINTFALPNLQSRTPTHPGGPDVFVQGQFIGAETITLTTAQIPGHSHQALASAAATGLTASPTNAVWAAPDDASWSSATPDTAMAPGAIGQAGGGQPHENRSPYLVLNVCIALSGIFPSRN